MSATLQDVQKIPYALSELDADGNPSVDPGDSVAMTLDSQSPGTVVPDATIDPTKLPSTMTAAQCLQTGFVVATGVGTINWTATYTHTDGTTPPAPVTGSIPVSVGPPATGSVTFGTPVSQ